MVDNNNSIPFELVDRDLYCKNTPRELISIDQPIQLCPKCHTRLYSSCVYIPVSETEQAKILGLECKICHRLYVLEIDGIRNILIDNKYARFFTLDDVDYTCFTEQEYRRKKNIVDRSKRELLNKVENSLVYVSLVNDDRTIEYIITDNIGTEMKKKSEDQLYLINVIKFTDPIAIEIFAGIYRPERKQRVKIEQETFQINCTVLSDNEQNEIKTLIPQDVKIKSGGGYENRCEHSYCKIVNLLFYSPFEDRYVPVRVTHDTHLNDYYMDISIYKDHVRKYGNPGIRLLPEKSTGNTFEDFAAESILRLYGYHVGGYDGTSLSDKERLDMLKEIIDLGLVEKTKVINHLNFLIGNSNEKYNGVRYKWEMDLNAIMPYKENPARFGGVVIDK
jgi:hypothetical protein